MTTRYTEKGADLLILTSALLFSLGAPLVLSSDAHAQDAQDTQDAQGSRDRRTPSEIYDWSPSLGVELGIHIQEFEAAGTASFGATDLGTNTVSTLIARLEAGVDSPPLSMIPGQPRLHLRAGTSFPTRESATVSSSQRVGDDSELGTEFFVSWKAMWHVGLDLRLELPIDRFRITVRPGIEYLGSRIRFEPLFTFRAEPGSPAAQQTSDPFNPPRLEFRGRSSPTVNHFVGPTFAVEAAFAEVGPLSINVYLQGRMYWLVDDRDTELNFSRDFLGTLESATGRLESSSIAGQVGFGIQCSF